MSFLMLSLIFVNLAILLCVRNFFIQIVSMKFALDAGFLFLCSFNKNPEALQSLAWFLLSLGMTLIFLLMIVGLKKTVQVKKSKQVDIF